MRGTRSIVIGTGLSAAGALALAAGAARADIVSRITAMTGMQETPPNASPALGAGRFIIDTDTNTVNYRIAWFGLGAPETAANIHTAAPGVPGGVSFPLPLGALKVGAFVYAEAQEATLLNGGMYVNIHSAGFPGGEIRGQIMTHVCLLDGAQETPPVPTGAQGFGLFNVDPVADTISYYIAYAGLTSAENAAHIHGIASYATPAGIIIPLPAGNPKSGVAVYPAALEQAILDGLTYVNIHTVGFGGGEIRGQIVSAISIIDGPQETPPSPSLATGFTMAALDRTAGVLGFDIRRGTIASGENNAHIHGFAPMGVPAGVLFGLPLTPRKMGVWGFGVAALPPVVDEQTYVNIHSNAFPGGEIRGQILFPCLLRIASGPVATTVYNGSPASMTVSAGGTGSIKYQWRRNLVALANGGRISGADSPTLTINPTLVGDSGNYDCVITTTCGTKASPAAPLTVLCYANCDESTAAPVLNVGDFTCFLQKYAANASYANCDESTAPPTLNVGDFTCFLQKYAAGCP